ncbi:ABC transporter permease [Candidatus Neomarinimicrobiota bacterium]
MKRISERTLAMRIVLGLILIIHSIAHLVGFVVPWKLAVTDEAPYKTTLIDGALDVGDSGIRFVGLLWLIGALVFTAVATGVLGMYNGWQKPLVYATVYSLILCILGLPDSRMGIPVNMTILAWLLAGQRQDWWG